MTCNWPLEPDALPEDWETKPEPVRLRAHTLASNTMVRLTGHRVGVCPVTIRPMRSQCERIASADRFGNGSGPGFDVVNWGGTWSNRACGCTAHRCAVELPAPVGRIDEVRLDGAVLDPSMYRVDNGSELTWTGVGDCPFPRYQDVNLPDTEPGTMSVTYVNAYLPGPDGAYAVTALTYEFAQSMVSGHCRLPQGVTSIVRQGISMDIAPGSFPDGKTGITEVDAYTALWNPRNISPPLVVSFDLPGHRRIGG